MIDGGTFFEQQVKKTHECLKNGMRRWFCCSISPSLSIFQAINLSKA